MIGRRTVIDFSLLCALLFSVIAVQSASAAPATNTTAVTCVNVGANKGDFKDAHCDEKVEANKGGFAHKALGSELGKTTNITVTNETTGGATSNQVLKGEPFGVKTTVTCTTVKGSGSIGNTELEAGVHKISGNGTIEYTGCTVTEVTKCTNVKEPIVAKIGSVEGVEGLTGPKGEKEAMGLEYKTEAGKPFTEITLEGTCAIAGKAFPVEGSVIATSGPAAGEAQNNHWSGATQVFETGNGMNNLKAGGKPATYTGITTTRMEGGDPISATTCTKSNCLEYASAPATNTTAFTCVNVGANKGDFKDAHCDEKVAVNKGEFAHKALGSELGNTTEIEVTNETTGGAKSSQVLKGEPFGVKTTVTCTTVKSTGSIGNTEPEAGVHKISGNGTIEYTGCTVTEVSKCTKVKEPVVAKIGSVEGVEGLTGPKGEKEAMGLEYKSEAGKPFAELTLEGTCAIQGKPFPVEGSIIATGGPAAGAAQNPHWAGATQVFEAGNEMSKLTAGGKPATYTGITTTRMKGGDPISATTCTKTSNCSEYSPAPATNTTAVTCVQVAAGTNGEFKDAHCDEKSTTLNGYEHKALGSGLGNTTNITVSNETTGGAKSNQVLKGEPFGVKTTVTCTTVKGSGSIGNTEPVGGEHKISGNGTIEYTGCTVTEVSKCTKVKEPVVAKIGSVEGVEGLTGPKGEEEAMGLEYKSEAGKPFAEITLEGTCAIQGKPFPVEGSISATGGPAAGSVQNNHWSGATQVFEAGNGMSKLTAGGKPATYTGITTTRMEGGNPISATTCTKTANCLE